MMNIKRYRFCLIVILFVHVGCSSGEKPGKVLLKDIDQYLNHFSVERKMYDQILIIPNLGCISCNDVATQYFIEHMNDERLLFIFTNIYDVKLFYNSKIGKYLERHNVIVDEYNHFSHLGFYIVYPSYLTTYKDKYAVLQAF